MECAAAKNKDMGTTNVMCLNPCSNVRRRQSWKTLQSQKSLNPCSNGMRGGRR